MGYCQLRCYTWDVHRSNPKRFADTIHGIKLFEEKIFGFNEVDLYPHVVYNDRAFSFRKIAEMDQWIRENDNVWLPENIQDLTFKNVRLLMLMSKSFRTVVWYLYENNSTLVLGRGTVGLDEGDNTFHTITGFVAFQGFRLYEEILHRLVAELGPIKSSTSLSEGAKKAWERAGAVWRAEERRWELV